MAATNLQNISILEVDPSDMLSFYFPGTWGRLRDLPRELRTSTQVPEGPSRFLSGLITACD